MPFETKTYQPGGLIAGDFPVMHRTVEIASGNLKRGTVLARHTGNDNYVIAAVGGANGTANPGPVLAEDVDASAEAKNAPVYFTGEFAADKLIFGTDHDADTVEAYWRQNNLSLFVRKRA